ncbi:MAG: thioredoxin-disulfide reductase [Lachnospiraceae bacterium]|nr:thioredoxin-disulfide reductase [Lachnospiraceae bacterium]
MLDMIIIGSGPAGMASAIYAARAELEFLVIEQSVESGGQVQQTYEVDNYPGIPGVSGPELSRRMREHCDKLGVEFKTEEVKSVEKVGADADADGKAGEYFLVKTWDGNEYCAKTVIAATGASHSTLGVPGEDVLQGMGVSYCATCDGAFFKNKVVAVVGGGDVAVEDAIYLSKLCTKVYLIHRRDEFRAASTLVSEAKTKENIEFVLSSGLKEIRGNNKVESILIENKKTGEVKEEAVNGVFIAVGIKPASELFTGLAKANEGGYLIADETCETSCKGLFAAGDIRAKQLRQIITAAADGANAVTSAQRLL